jgi:Endonuclease I/Secretion system C-terminal sorting domain
MIKNISLLVNLLFCCFAYSQLVINEVDSNTPSTDVLEFVELKSDTPNFSLDGYTLVFYNGGSAGAGTLSYFALDLDGYTTDINGIIHFGNSQVSPAPIGIIPNETIQNGPDVIAIYQANASDFPLDTPAHTTGFVSGLAYSNSNTTSPSQLMSILGITVFTNENLTSNGDTRSIQRNSDGTYSVALPTPGYNNDGSGVVLNGITITPSVSFLTEGQQITITFTTNTPVTTSDLNINLSLTNGSVNSSDFSGSLTTTIPVGQTTVNKVFTIVDDSLNEGDEQLLIRVTTVANGFILINNSILVRVHDNDFIVQPWGTPLAPTYAFVAPTTPAGYYSSLEGLSGAALKQAVQNIIADPSVVRAHSYGDVNDILLQADQNPANSGQVWLMYVERPMSKIDIQTSSSNIGVWNREHIWPQSRGGFQDGTSSFPDGINVWLPTNADDILSGHSDAHHLRAEDGAENSLRSNRDYGSDYNGPSGNAGSWKGDVARSLFYMAVRYNGLNLVNGNPADNIVGQMGDLASLLVWNTLDPRDDFEMNRNNYIYTWQYNRNPFIDYPNLADYIWGAQAGLPWFAPLATTTFADFNVVVYPNPVKSSFTIAGLTNQSTVEVYNSLGAKVYENGFQGDTVITANWSSGLYFARISSEGKSVVKKLVVE